MTGDRSPRDAGELFLVTGISGTGVTGALAKAAARDKRLSVVKVEDYLRLEARTPLEDVLQYQVRAFPEIVEAFALPERVLRDLWRPAFLAALRDDHPFTNGPSIERALKDGDVLLNLHASWQHLEWQSFVPGVHYPTLASVLPVKPRAVIPLIDDIYDVFLRLSRPDQIYEGTESVMGALLDILFWREFEVRESELIARDLEVPHVLFAVKHPIETFLSVLYDERDHLSYISHPITVPRKAGLYLKGRPLMDYVMQTAQGLREDPEITLLEPTTIDEWRFDVEDEEFVSKRLKPRWVLGGDAEDLMWDPLTSAEQSALDDVLTRTEEPVEALELLAAQVLRQINWRDRKMVEQSSGLFLVEPFAAESGKLSGGVLEEVVLHEHLRQYETGQGENRRVPPVVYHPPEAELRRKVGSVMDVCLHASELGDISGWPTGETETKIIREALRNEPLEEWRDADPNEVGDALSAFFLKLRLDPKPEIVVSGKKGSLQKGKKKTGVYGVRARLGKTVISALRGVAHERTDYALSSVHIDPEGSSIQVIGPHAHGRDLAHAMAEKARALRDERPSGGRD